MRLLKWQKTMELHNRLDDQKFTDRLKEIKAAGRDLQPVLEECAEITVSSIEKNFDTQGRFSEAGSWRGGSNRWAPSAAAKARGGMTLSDSGQLRASIQSQVSGDQAEIGTNKVYAAMHNFGFDGDVTVRSHTRNIKTKKTIDVAESARAGAHKRNITPSKSVTVREHKRKMHMPARPYMVVQDEDIDEMLDVAADHLLKP